MVTIRSRTPRQRVMGAVMAASVLAATGCGVSGVTDAERSDKTTTTAPPSTSTASSSTPNTTDTTVASADPAEALRDAADATLAVSSFTVESQAELEVGPQRFRLTSSGSFDYDAVIGDLQVKVDATESQADLIIRTDGDKLWVRTEGDDAPALPGGKTWLEGDHDLLASSDTVEPSGVIGVIIALRGAEEATVVDSGEADGVETTIYETTVSYDEAVKAAGQDSEAFATALQLTAPSPPDLVMTVEVGSDGIIRNFDLVVEPTDASPLGGSYQIELTDVNDEVDVPDAPPADDTLTGPEADKILEGVIG